jgi:hypothetical protein
MSKWTGILKFSSGFKDSSVVQQQKDGKIRTCPTLELSGQLSHASPMPSPSESNWLLFDL